MSLKKNGTQVPHTPIEPGSYMTTLIATSVVRGSQQGESHGGVFLIDLENRQVAQALDWNTTSIDWQGRGWDRGLRGIAFDDDKIYIAASDELFVYNQNFEQLASYRCPYLKHCHEISRYQRRLYLSSTGYDSVIGFDLDNLHFSWGMNIAKTHDGFRGTPFNPLGNKGPAPSNELHINNVHCVERGMYISGRKTGALLKYTGKQISAVATLPDGVHNAQPYADGVLFIDSDSDVLRFESRDKQRIFEIPQYDQSLLTHTELGDSRVARQGFGRGLCIVGDGVIAAGSSPSTITLHNLDSMKTTLSVNLTMDVRNAIHGLEVWPYPV
jgi:hypothetical protein